MNKFSGNLHPAHEQLFEFSVAPGARHWKWRVCDYTGRVLMQGREKSRPAARYRGERALFLLLLSRRVAGAPSLCDDPGPNEK